MLKDMIEKMRAEANKPKVINNNFADLLALSDEELRARVNNDALATLLINIKNNKKKED